MMDKEIRLLLPAAGRYLPYIGLGIIAMIVILCTYLFAPEHKIMAQCRDGTVSYSKHRSGTCSRHDGVYQWVKDKK